LWKRNVLRCWRKTGSEGDDWTSTGSVFQSVAPATGKERRPMVDKRNGGTCSWCYATYTLLLIVFVFGSVIYVAPWCTNEMFVLWQNFRVTDAIQKVTESYKCKPIEGTVACYVWIIYWLTLKQCNLKYLLCCTHLHLLSHWCFVYAVEL